MFHRTHPDAPHGRMINGRTIWLPHLPGTELRNSLSTAAVLSAFAELGRFHRLGERSLHGDPHAGNFLHDPASCRSHIIDFETTVPDDMPGPQGRARDFAILALDVWKHGQGTPADLDGWRDAYAGDEGFCPVNELFHRPGFRLRSYWKLLGYDPPAFSRI